MRNLLLLSLLLIIGMNAIQAQDKITLKNGETLLVKVVEFGVEDVKYRMYEAPDDAPIYAKEKYRIQKVQLQSGEEFSYALDAILDPVNYEGQKRHALKFGFLSPFNNIIALGYERSIRPGRSMELGLGYIGAGFGINSEGARGATMNAGWKFINIGDNPTMGGRYAHLLKGSYIKPELIFTAYSADYTVWDWPNPITTERQSFFAAALLLNFGKQWVFDDIFLVDVFLGVGYGYHSESINRYGFFGGEQNLPIVVNGGIRVGLLIQ